MTQQDDELMTYMSEKLGPAWTLRLKDTIISSQFKALGDFIRTTRLTKIVYPDNDTMFRAFKLTPFDDVRVVILGQDPYHDGSATGLRKAWH